MLELFERTSGARMHVALYRPAQAGLASLSASILEDILEFTHSCMSTLDELHNTLTYNKI